ncbi:hypothetical protein VTO73DRAFT_4881 [Trametes versicolor]
MVNPTGRNGYDNGTIPSDEELSAALQQYAKERLPAERRIARLKAEFGYSIGTTKLKDLQRKFGIATVRKPPPLPVASTLVCAKASEDPFRRKGPNTVKNQLAVEGFQIPRSVVRSVMHTEDPTGAAIRHPRAGNHIIRKVLTAKGVWHEISVDGHEKLGPVALEMGGVGFHIYGMREKWSGRVLWLVVVPNSRVSAVVGHIYLDCVGFYGVMARQMTFDGGSETQDMKAAHVALRTQFAPELDADAWPPYVPLKSTHNISIENLWSRWLTYDGWNLQKVLMEGRSNGLFNPADALDTNLFQWLWPHIIQKKLDEFKEFWNCHRVRSQRKKQMPCNSSPNDIFTTPQDYGGENLGIQVQTEFVEGLRAALPISRKEAFQFVDDEFLKFAEHQTQLWTSRESALVRSFSFSFVTFTVALNALTQFLLTGSLSRPLFGHSAILPRTDEDFNVELFHLGTASMDATMVGGLGNEVGGVTSTLGASVGLSRPDVVRGELELNRMGITALSLAYELCGAALRMCERSTRPPRPPPAAPSARRALRAVPGASACPPRALPRVSHLLVMRKGFVKEIVSMKRVEGG